jgi:pyridoxamine 5'-phosphate oxidase
MELLTFSVAHIFRLIILVDNLGDIRNNYKKQTLRVETLDRSPVRQFESWLQEAIDAGHPESTAMTLATVDACGQPWQRIVLLKNVVDDGLCFFTNYLSRKGRQLQENPRVAASFFWPLLGRQVRLQGVVKKISAHESDVYFASRPRESQLGAWASPQSDIIRDRNFLVHRYQEFEQKYEGKSIPRPPYWGGYVLKPHRFEFWQGGEGRMHHRFEYRLNGGGEWEIVQLAP